VVAVQVDADSGQVATAACPVVRTEYFIEGTQPVEMCHLHGGGAVTQVAGWDLSRPAQPSSVAPNRPDRPTGASPDRQIAQSQPVSPQAAPATVPPQAEAAKKRKGFFGRLRDIFK